MVSSAQRTDEEQQAALASMVMTGDVPLSTPIGDIEQLHLRRPRLGDMRGVKLRFDGGGRPEIDIADIITVAARLSGQPEAVIDQLTPQDALSVGGLVLAFFGTAPTTGNG